MLRKLIVHSLNSSIQRRRDLVRLRWQRVLPVGEYLSDRHEKAGFLGFGQGTTIYDSSLVFGDVQVGRNTWIGPFTILDGSGGLTIGDNCSISAGVQIYTHDTVQRTVTGGVVPTVHSPTKIEANVYIGPNTIIQMGVTIGSKTIIGANSLVNTDIPSNTKAWGSPCRIFSQEE